MWKTSVENHLGARLDQWQRVGGGDFAQSYCATVVGLSSSTALDDSLQGLAEMSPGLETAEGGCVPRPLAVGERLFVKTHRKPPPLHFTTEALGLIYLARTQTVQVPDVLGASDDPPFLALRWVSPDQSQRRSADGERQFGEQLAALHKMTCQVFGREDGRSTGSLGLPNQASDQWADFYRNQRLIPLMEIAAARQSLLPRVLDKIERVAAKLTEFVPADTRPSWLHGDLWAGNRLIDENGRSWMIDPACHGGHREFDLAMMRLFGGFDADCHSAYQTVWPLDDGWKERVSLHQLAPLIVHAIKFGAAYRQATEDALDQYL